MKRRALWGLGLSGLVLLSCTSGRHIELLPLSALSTEQLPPGEDPAVVLYRSDKTELRWTNSEQDTLSTLHEAILVRAEAAFDLGELSLRL